MNTVKPCKDYLLTFQFSLKGLIKEKTMGFSRGPSPLELDYKLVP